MKSRHHKCHSNSDKRKYRDANINPPIIPLEPMTQLEAEVTFNRYKNTDVIWSPPKGILYGNIPGATNAQKANLYPDGASTYFVADIILPRRSKLILDGQYPHSRYFSFTIASDLGNGQLGNGISLEDADIVPNRGSKNPFIPSNSRNVVNRNYTVYIKWGNAPIKPEPNTLYVGRLTNERVHLSLRCYLSDEGYDGTGVIKLSDDDGFGLPDVTLKLESGETISGPQLLKVLQATKNGDPNGYTVAQWLSEVKNSKDPISAPATNPPVTEIFWNTDYSITGLFIVDTPLTRVIRYPPTNSGGFANNPATKYILSILSFSFNDIVVIEGKMPTHPATRRGENTLPKDPQVQYFSISTAASPPSGEGWVTIFDEQIPIDKNGHYKVVISWPWNRPGSAIESNGFIWLNPSNGEGHYIGSRIWVLGVYFRFILPSPNWKESPDTIPMPTVEKPVVNGQDYMGEYWPVISYTSMKEFDMKYAYKK